MPKVIFEFKTKHADVITDDAEKKHVVEQAISLSVSMEDGNPAKDTGPDDVYAHLMMRHSAEIMQFVTQKFKEAVAANGGCVKASTIIRETDTDSIH